MSWAPGRTLSPENDAACKAEQRKRNKNLRTHFFCPDLFFPALHSVTGPCPTSPRPAPAPPRHTLPAPGLPITAVLSTRGPRETSSPAQVPAVPGHPGSHLAGRRSPTPPGHGAAGADLASPSSLPTWRPPHPPCSSSHSWRCPPGLCPALRSSWSLRPPPYLPGSSPFPGLCSRVPFRRVPSSSLADIAPITPGPFP